MTSHHSPWPLFCNDLNQAQQWVRSQLAHNPADKQLGHQALSLGLTETVLCILGDRNQSLEDQTRRQWRFRLARMNGAQNPYSELIPPDLQKFTDLQMAYSRHTGTPAFVSVDGGIGDHLEVISALLEWSKINNQTFALLVTPERKKILRPIVKSCSELTLQSSMHPRAIHSMAMREWICRHLGSIRYKTCIENTIKEQVKDLGTLFCWKAKGQDNHLSAYHRSVPFELVLNYYKTKKRLHPKLTLIDISEWNHSEKIVLEKAEVQCINPNVLGLSGLIKICRKNQVITIDTALAHLCAVTGNDATLLLNHMPDERWVELHRPENCYGKHLKIIQQTKFYDWEDSLSSLLNLTLDRSGSDT